MPVERLVSHDALHSWRRRRKQPLLRGGDRNEKAAETEVFYTDKSADEDGVSRGIVYSDNNGKTTKSESFYTDKFTRKNGFNRKNEYFDNDGKATKTELYMNDRLIKTD